MKMNLTDLWSDVVTFWCFTLRFFPLWESLITRFSIFHPSNIRALGFWLPTWHFVCLITCSRASSAHDVRGLSSSLDAALITSRSKQHLQFKQATLILSAAPPSAEARPLRRAAASKLLLVWLTPKPVTVVESRPPPHKGSFALMLSEADPRLCWAVMMLYFPACLTTASWLL